VRAKTAVSIVTKFSIPIPAELVDEIAERAAELVLERLEPEQPTAPGPYLTIAEAAELLRCRRQRVYDLLSARRLQRFKDGSRVLVRRDEIDAYLGRESGSNGVAPTLPRTPQPRMGSGLAGRPPSRS
jgi:excisionase family DNA binding protein